MIKTLLALLIPAALSAQHMIDIYDGDTFKYVETGERVRLYGIDTPEFNRKDPAKTQPYGLEATKALRDAIATQELGIQRIEKGKYGRTIGLLRYMNPGDGTTVQAKLVASGLAWVYPQYCKRPECDSWRRLERIAREQRRGLWADDNPMPPWEWRREKRGK